MTRHPASLTKYHSLRAPFERRGRAHAGLAPPHCCAPPCLQLYTTYLLLPYTALHTTDTYMPFRTAPCCVLPACHYTSRTPLPTFNLNHPAFQFLYGWDMALPIRDDRQCAAAGSCDCLPAGGSTPYPSSSLLASPNLLHAPAYALRSPHCAVLHSRFSALQRLLPIPLYTGLRAPRCVGLFAVLRYHT